MKEEIKKYLQIKSIRTTNDEGRPICMWGGCSKLTSHKGHGFLDMDGKLRYQRFCKDHKRAAKKTIQRGVENDKIIAVKKAEKQKYGSMKDLQNRPLNYFR